MLTHYVGVDWSSGAWVAVQYSDVDETPTVEVHDQIRTVWEAYEDTAKRIVVDVPIGLCTSLKSDDCPCVKEDGELSRACDDLARDVIGPRSSSVFTAPAREATKLAADEETEYTKVSETNKDLTGKGLMRQAANISKGIVEVEQLLLDGSGNPGVLVEGHPEVCFRAFNETDLQHSKKTAPGVCERLSALENVTEYTKGDWRPLANELRNEDRRVQLDDLLDALALALTAHAPKGKFHQLPSDPPADEEEFPMQMVYRRDEPFTIEA